jgi:hypothetical protein
LMAFSKSSFGFRFCLASLHLSMFKTISIGFMSGDSDGQHSHHLMLFFCHEFICYFGTMFRIVVLLKTMLAGENALAER